MADKPETISATANSELPRDDMEIKHQPDAVSVMSVQKPFPNSDILFNEQVDPVFTAKLHLVNNAIDEIGWTGYHWKLFCLTGFGYAVDSMIIQLKSVALTAVTYEFAPSYGKALVMSSHVGLFVGAIFWGFTADIIGRKWAFNLSLVISGVFGIVAGASPNWVSLCSFVALLAFGAGGNLVLDTTVFLEYLPSKKQYVLTLLACWWGIGTTFTGLIAWAFLPQYTCASAKVCTRENNMGWRYVFWTCCSVMLLMSVLRVTVIRLRETPKFLLGEGKDDEVVAGLQEIAKKYNRPCSITLEGLEACGVTEVRDNHAKNKYSLSELLVHLRGLFSTKRIGLSTCLIWLSWSLIGLAYPLYNVFLPTYLASRGAQFGQTSSYITWRNYALGNLASIGGPILAGALAETKFLGRKYTMVIGALLTMIFLFAYTQVRNNEQNVGFTCAINFCLNVYYATLYAYSPEVLPTAHRATGNGIAVAFARIMAIISVVVATYTDLNTAAPIYVCAVMFVLMAITSLLFPFEPYGRRSS